jgi:hypothetical protein
LFNLTKIKLAKMEYLMLNAGFHALMEIAPILFGQV